MIDLPNYRSGDMWPGATFQIDWADASRPGTVASATMCFHNKGTLGLLLSTAGSQITITNATDWILDVPKRVLAIDSGIVWDWYVKVVNQFG